MVLSCGLHTTHFAVPGQEAPVPLHLVYPADAPEREERFGPYSFCCARDARPCGDRLPLVAVSHGSGGTPWTWRGLARHLALAGFAVALFEHLGNSSTDNHLAGTAACLELRPLQLSSALDAAFADTHIGPYLMSDRTAIIGHSMGGCTALSLAGAQPWAAAHETGDGRPRPVPVSADARIRALLLFAPALFWFIPGSLAKVRIPILLRAGEHDHLAPPAHAETLLALVPDAALVEYQMVPGAGHFSFMSPFPPEMTRSEFPPSQDPEGFDRAALQPAVFAETTEFLRRVLA